MMLIENVYMLDEILKNININDFIKDLGNQYGPTRIYFRIHPNARDYYLFFKKKSLRCRAYQRFINISFCNFTVLSPIWVNMMENSYRKNRSSRPSQQNLIQIIEVENPNQISAADLQIKQKVIELGEEKSYDILLKRIQDYQLKYV